MKTIYTRPEDAQKKIVMSLSITAEYSLYGIAGSVQNFPALFALLYFDLFVAK
jgi:hypothetical protein